MGRASGKPVLTSSPKAKDSTSLRQEQEALGWEPERQGAGHQSPFLAKPTLIGDCDP